jgi:hypothetical protein
VVNLIPLVQLFTAEPAFSEPLRQRQGPYEVTLMLPPAGLYAGEEMEIEFRVVEPDAPGADGGPKPLAGTARIQAEASMPSMPSMAKFEELAHREAIAGVFGVHPVFPHGGDYRLCLTILPSEFRRAGDPGPAEPLTFEFPLVVEDAASSPTPAGRRVRPFALDVSTTPRRPVAGEPVEIDLSVRMASSFERREVADFELQHEKLMHLFIVRDDLSVFAHEHPELSGPGVFRLRYRFPSPGRYRVFADVAPRDAGSQVLSSIIEFGGAAPPPPAPARVQSVPKTRVALAWPEGGVRAGRTATVDAILTDADGRPVRDLQPWLGAMGHWILVHADGETFAHAHPDEREAGVGAGGRIPFLVRLPRAGRYRGWMQFQRGGAVETIEVEVEATPN